MSYFVATYRSPLGEMSALCDDEAVLELCFGGNEKLTRAPKNAIEAKCPAYLLCEKWLDIYFAGEIPSFTPPIKLENVSPFQKAALDILTKIPYGQTKTYGQIARELEQASEKRACAQAVGGAVGKNPIAVIIPCHRVLGAGEKLVGYAGGLDKKIALLKIEKIPFVY